MKLVWVLLWGVFSRKFRRYRKFSKDWYNVLVIESRNTFREESDDLTRQLLEEIDHYSKFPEQVLLATYHIRLGNHTYWIQNYPYSYAHETNGVWYQRSDDTPPYYARHSYEQYAPIPNAEARYALNKFITEFGSRFTQCEVTEMNSYLWKRNPRRVIPSGEVDVQKDTACVPADGGAHAGTVVTGRSGTAKTGECQE